MLSLLELFLIGLWALAVLFVILALHKRHVRRQSPFANVLTNVTGILPPELFTYAIRDAIGVPRNAEIGSEGRRLRVVEGIILAVGDNPKLIEVFESITFMKEVLDDTNSMEMLYTGVAREVAERFHANSPDSWNEAHETVSTATLFAGVGQKSEHTPEPEFSLHPVDDTVVVLEVSRLRWTTNAKAAAIDAFVDVVGRFLRGNFSARLSVRKLNANEELASRTGRVANGWADVVSIWHWSTNRDTFAKNMQTALTAGKSTSAWWQTRIMENLKSWQILRCDDRPKRFYLTVTRKPGRPVT